MQNAEAGASADCSRSARDNVPTIHVVVQTTLHCKGYRCLRRGQRLSFQYLREITSLGCASN